MMKVIFIYMTSEAFAIGFWKLKQTAMRPKLKNYCKSQ